MLLLYIVAYINLEMFRIFYANMALQKLLPV